MDMSIHVPSLPEQEAIGYFFQDLDKAIAKQEEKVNQLKRKQTNPTQKNVYLRYKDRKKPSNSFLKSLL